MNEKENDTAMSSPAAFAAYKGNSERKSENPLRDIILGGQDGLVNALGIILGVSAAGGTVGVLIATVMAASAAESISMGTVAYTSAVAQQDHFEAERGKVKKEIENVPAMAKEEVRQIFERKGFSGGTLSEIVETITKDKNLWLKTILGEELHVHTVETRSILKSSFIVGLATAIGSIIPVLPFFFVGDGINFHTGQILSVSVCALALFGVGAYQAFSLVGTWWKSGLRMVVIGLSAAVIGYFIAKLFHASVI